MLAAVFLYGDCSLFGLNGRLYRFGTYLVHGRLRRGRRFDLGLALQRLYNVHPISVVFLCPILTSLDVQGGQEKTTQPCSREVVQLGDHGYICNCHTSDGGLRPRDT